MSIPERTLLQGDDMTVIPNWVRCVPVLSVMGIIFFMSNQPGDSIELIDIPNIDKILHSFVYAVLGYAALFAVSPSRRQHKSGVVSILVILFCILFGISDEFHQSFIPGRLPSSWDLLADTLGGIIAVISWYKYVEPVLREKATFFRFGSR